MKMMSYRNPIALLFGALLALAALPAAAQNAAGGSTVDIESGIFLAKNRDLKFGSIVQPTGPGTVVVQPAGTVQTTGGIVHAGGATSAEFIASSSLNANRTFWIQLPNTVALTGPAPLSATGFVASANIDTRCISYAATAPAGPANVCPAVKSGTSVIFQVGATISLSSGQAKGTYSGTFDVTLTQW